MTPTSNSVLVLGKGDVEKLLSMDSVISIVEEALRLKGMGEAQMPPKQYLYLEDDGDLRVMPAYVKGMGAAGVKVVNSYPRNRGRGLPSVMAIVELVEPSTGRPVALMDGTEITAYRTGAAAAVATKYLAREDATSMCIIGAGAQSYRQLDAISKVRDIDSLRIYDISRGAGEALASYARAVGKRMKVEVCDGARACAEGADILVTVTPAKEPVVMDEWVGRGTHVNAMGADAPGKEELDPRILLRSKIVVDDMEQTVHSGEVNVPISRGILSRDRIYAELGEIVVGKKPGRASRDEVTLFDSTGLAIFDVTTAKRILDEAIKMGIGSRVEGLGF